MYESELSNPLLQITAISSTIPTYVATVNTSFGKISLPSNLMPLSTNSDQSKTFSGRIDQINLALSQIEYQVPGPSMPYINTMSRINSQYGNVQCDLQIIIDDKGYLTEGLNSDKLSPLGQPVTTSGQPYQLPIIKSPSIFSFNTLVFLYSARVDFELTCHNSSFERHRLQQ